MFNPRNSAPSFVLLFLALGTTAAGEAVVGDFELPGWTYPTLVAVTWSLFTNVVVAFWLLRRGYKQHLAQLVATVSQRDRIAFESALRRMEALDQREHAFLLVEEQYAPNLIRCLRHVTDSCNYAASLQWSSVQESCQAGLNLVATGALGILDETDRMTLESVLRLNASAGEAYAGPHKTPADEYGLSDVSAQVAAIANDATTSPLAGLAALQRVAELSEADATTTAEFVSDQVHSCLIDALLVGSIGMLLEQDEVVVRDVATASALRLEPHLVGDGRVAFARVEPLVAALLHEVLGVPSVDVAVQRVSDKWDGTTLIFPRALLDVNVHLFRRAEPSAYTLAERQLSSASSYFEDELAITRINICVAAFLHWSGGRHAPRIATCLAELAPHLTGKFYSDAIRQIAATYELVRGNAAALLSLEDLARSSSVFPVRKSTLETLLWWYATKRSFADFARVSQLRRAVAEIKGNVVTESKMEAYANRGVAVAKWYFITLPAKRTYEAWYPAVFTRPVA